MFDLARILARNAAYGFTCTRPAGLDLKLYPSLQLSSLLYSPIILIQHFSTLKSWKTSLALTLVRNPRRDDP